MEDSDEGREHSTIYPDLDYVPSYPWLWQQNNERASGSANQEGQRMNTNLEDQSDDEMGDSLEDKELGLSHEVIEGTDPAVDPDYNITDGSITYEGLLSITMYKG